MPADLLIQQVASLDERLPSDVARAEAVTQSEVHQRLSVGWQLVCGHAALVVGTESFKAGSEGVLFEDQRAAEPQRGDAGQGFAGAAIGRLDPISP